MTVDELAKARSEWEEDIDNQIELRLKAEHELKEARAELESLREELRIQKRMALRLESCLHDLIKETEES